MNNLHLLDSQFTIDIKMASSLAWHRQAQRPQTAVQLTPPAQHVSGEAVIAFWVNGVGPGADDEGLHVALVDPAPDAEVATLAPLLSPAVGCHLERNGLLGLWTGIVLSLKIAQQVKLGK